MSDDKPTESAPSGAARERRRAEALRANLRRRRSVEPDPTEDPKVENPKTEALDPKG
jgi:hypothetical protein